MFATSLVLAASLVAVETGWQPHEAGGLEYIIQIEPELLASLREGEALTSEVPPEVQGVRRYRIQIGRGPLPRIGEQPLPAPPAVQPEVHVQPEPAVAPPLHAAPPRDQFPPLPVEQTPPAAAPPADPPQGKVFAPPDFYGPSTSATEPPRTNEIPPADAALPAQTPPAINTAPRAEEPPSFEVPQDRYQFPEFNPQPPVKTAPADPPAKTVTEVEPPRIFNNEPDSMQTTFKAADNPSTSDGFPPNVSPGLPATPAAPAKPDSTEALGWSFAMLILVGSMAANLYLAWMWLDTRRRYLSLIYKRSMAL